MFDSVVGPPAEMPRSLTCHKTFTKAKWQQSWLATWKDSKGFQTYPKMWQRCKKDTNNGRKILKPTVSCCPYLHSVTHPGYLLKHTPATSLPIQDMKPVLCSSMSMMWLTCCLKLNTGISPGLIDHRRYTHVWFSGGQRVAKMVWLTVCRRAMQSWSPVTGSVYTEGVKSKKGEIVKGRMRYNKKKILEGSTSSRTTSAAICAPHCSSQQKSLKDHLRSFSGMLEL
mmetsp:Transcript_8516/g.19305  ORF Transcript_8516/g.19305 Transcript_8516/m.19305 type:complete len:226 (-) Transcript_8516:44-721(-)